MTLKRQRQQQQLDFLARGEQIELGRVRDCARPLEQLLAPQSKTRGVIEVFDHGLTATAFRLRVDGRDWAAKRAVRGSRGAKEWRLRVSTIDL